MQKTETNIELNILPKRNDCRVDYTTIGGRTYSMLINYSRPEHTVISYEIGVYSVVQMYSELKWLIKNSIPIDNYPGFATKPFEMLRNGCYKY